jgi:hypothetical protein
MVGTAGRQSGGLRRLHHAQAVLRDAFHQQESTLRRQARILVSFYPGAPPIMSVSVLSPRTMLDSILQSKGRWLLHPEGPRSHI